MVMATILLLLNLSCCNGRSGNSEISQKTSVPSNENVSHEPVTPEEPAIEPVQKTTLAIPNDKAVLFNKMRSLEAEQRLSTSDKSGLWFEYLRQYYLTDTKLISSQDDVSSIPDNDNLEKDIDGQASPGEPQSPGPASAEILGSLGSVFRDKITNYYAYVPLVAEPTSRFPVLYLLHGAYDDYSSWPTHCREQLKALAAQYGIIIICPDGEPFGWYANSLSDPHSQIEKYFVEELIPEIDRQFPVATGKRAIAGLSMGGHGALVLALRHPQLFTSVSSMSGILDITKHTKNWHLSEVFGPYEENTKEWTEHSAYQLCAKEQGRLIDFPIMATVGLDDTLALADNRAFNKLLSQLKLSIEYIYLETEGNHDWAYWSGQLPGHVEFHYRAGLVQDAIRAMRHVMKMTAVSVPVYIH